MNFAFWGLLMALYAYLVPDWHQMELFFVLPVASLVCVYWILPESPRWLLAQNRTEEATKIVKHIAEYNGKPLPEDFKLKPMHAV